MKKNNHLAQSLVLIIQSINLWSSLALMVFLLYSTYGLHTGSIGVLQGIGIGVAVVLVYGFTMKFLILLYPSLPIVLDLAWHGNSLSTINEITLTGSIVFLVVMVANQILARIAISKSTVPLG